jgi:hypothetical protein
MLLCIPPGIVVALVFFRSGLSQLWFQRSTVELVLLLSAWGLVSLLPDPLTGRTALRLSATAALAGLAAFGVSSYLAANNPTPQVASLDAVVATAITPGLVLLVVCLGYLLYRYSPVRVPSLAAVLVFVLGLSTTHVYAFAAEVISRQPTPVRPVTELFAPGGTVAARWLKRHSSPDAVVATNIHCLLPRAPHCDNRNFWVSAYTERRIVVEGWGYTAATNSGAISDTVHSKAPIPDQRRLAINDAAFEHPSAATVSRLVDTYGVDWLFVSKEYAVDLAGLSALTGILAKEYSNSNYVVFRVLR